jgi:hypothetical protein
MIGNNKNHLYENLIRKENDMKEQEKNELFVPVMRDEASGPQDMPDKMKDTFKAEQPYTFVAAYDSNDHWEWAKTPAGHYYSIEGKWVYTKAGWVFVTNSSAQDIVTACKKALGDRTFTQAYAAMNRFEFNHTIVPEAWFNQLYK